MALDEGSAVKDRAWPNSALLGSSEIYRPDDGARIRWLDHGIAACSRYHVAGKCHIAAVGQIPGANQSSPCKKVPPT